MGAQTPKAPAELTAMRLNLVRRADTNIQRRLDRRASIQPYCGHFAPKDAKAAADEVLAMS